MTGPAGITGQTKMVGIDTNVLIRYILQDDPVQSARAARLIESLTEAQPGYVTLVSVAEIFWVLDRSYKFTRIQFARVLGSLLDSEGIFFQEELLVAESLLAFSRSNTADFSDCLICLSATRDGCNAVMTFDKTAAKSAGMTLLT